VSIPVIADLDTGYGNVLNVWRTVREFAQVGVGAIQLEDQVTPKKCGHYSGKDVVPVDEMVAKIAAAKEARALGRFDIIARTDAIAIEGFEGAVARARAYRDGGADVVFVEAPRSAEQIRRIAEDLADVPLLINMFEGGKTPVVAPAELAAMGYRIVIIPSDLQRAAMRAMQRVADEIRAAGTSARLSDMLAGFDERDELIGKAMWDARAAI
jgi:2-methylisocitrate lyase-like PEP mutase family enzyme